MAFNIKNLQYGKKFMCLLDDDIQTQKWMVMDSDCFACTLNDPIKLFDILTSVYTDSSAIAYDYKLVSFEWKLWIDRIHDAIGQNVKKGEVAKSFYEHEQHAFESIGLTIDNARDTDKTEILRPTNKTVIFVLNRQSDLADFLRNNIGRCCEDEFLISMFSIQKPIIISFSYNKYLHVS